METLGKDRRGRSRWTRNQQIGDAMAAQAGWQAYMMLDQARREGHPFNGTIVLQNQPNTFGDGGWWDRTHARDAALHNYAQSAIRGNCLYQDSYGYQFYAPCQ